MKTKIFRFLRRIRGWKTRLGFYIITGDIIFKFYGYKVSSDVMVFGFALMLLGIAHKIEGK